MAVISSNDKDFENQIQQNEKVIVKFYADWCGSCKLLAPKYKKLSEKEEYHSVVFLEVNAEENPNARKLAQVKNLPTIATFKNGQLVESVPTSNENYVTKMLNDLG
jgi:thioredoxin